MWCNRDTLLYQSHCTVLNYTSLPVPPTLSLSPCHCRYEEAAVPARPWRGQGLGQAMGQGGGRARDGTAGNTALTLYCTVALIPRPCLRGLTPWRPGSSRSWATWPGRWEACSSLGWHRRNIYMGGISQDVKTQKKKGFLPSLLWVILTIYIFVALMKLTMCFKQLEASHIMSCHSWY